MKSKFRPLTVNLLQLWTILCLASCAATQITISKQIDIAGTEVSDKIPLKAGLYLSQSVRKAKYLLNYRQLAFGTAAAGDTLSYGSEKTMRDIFRDVAIVDSMEVLAPETYDVIVVPEVIKLNYDGDGCRGNRFTGSRSCIVETVIKWTIVSTEGKEIYVSSIKSDESNIRVSSRVIEQFIEASLKNNFQKAREDIYTNGWWKKTWWKRN